MNVGSLFSGIGGLDYGLHRAGFRHVWFCEADAYRREVLRARWPGVPVFDDVREVDAASLGGRRRALGAVGARADAEQHGSSLPVEPVDVDLLCGGFPCQDLSVAGQRRGLQGDRSGLFFEFARIIDTVRPRWVLLENVPGLLSSNGGRDFGTVLGTLADIGYGVAWRVLDSRFFGVPQRRRRVFIVGAVADTDPRAAAERAGQVLAVGTRCPRHPATRGEAGSAPPAAPTGGAGSGGWINSGAGWWDDDDGAAMTLSRRDWKDATTLVAAPLSHGSNPNSNAAGRRREDDENLVTSFHNTQDPISDPDVSLPLGRKTFGMGVQIGALREYVRPGSNTDHTIVQDASVRRLMPVECERLQALPDGWTDLGGTPDSKRYAAIGDAVTVNVAEWIGRRLIAA